MTKRIFSCMLAALCCLLAALSPLGGFAEGGVTLNANIGYDGVATYVRRVPVTVAITNNGPDVSGRIAVNVNRYGADYDTYELPVSVAAGATVSATIPVVLTHKQQAYTVRFLQGETELAAQTIKPETVINPSNLVVGTLGRDAQSLSWISIAKGSDPLARGEYWTPVALDEKTFPADAESLRFFDMLAVDGFDLSALSEAQKAAFDEWLRKGGIVLVGGGTRAAENFAFFKTYTGIRAGTLTEADVSGMLMDALDVSFEGLGQEAALVELENASGVPLGETRLTDAARVGEGYVVTLGFALGEKPLNNWLGKNAILQRILLNSAQARYKKIVEFRQRANYAEQGYYADAGVSNAIGVANGEGMIWPLVLLGAFIVLAGLGGYLILKKLDRREWMWAVVPALAIAASVGMWALSSRLPIREPVAVHYTILSIDENGGTEGYSVVTASRPEHGKMTLSVNSGTIDMTSTLSYYSSDDEPVQAGTELRYIYTCGAEESVTYQQKQAWETQDFIVRNAPVEDMSGVKGECVWDGENMTFTVTNGSTAALSEGAIVTESGYVSVPALLPGQTAQCVMRPYDPNAGDEDGDGSAQGAAKGAAGSVGIIGGASGPTAVFVSSLSSSSYFSAYDNVPQDGVYYDNLTKPNTFYAYDYVEAFLNAMIRTGDSEEWSLRSRMIGNTNLMNYDGLYAPFLYVAFSDELDTLHVKMDGEDVTREAQRGMIVAELHYNPISADGTAKFMKNSFPVSTALLDDAERPSAGEPLEADNYRSFSLSSSPAFAFDMSVIPEGMEITAFDVASRYNYYSYNVSLYNVRTHAWDAWKEFTTDPSGNNVGTSKAELPDLTKYIEDGMLYARFERADGGEEYADVSVPMLTLEGKVN